MKKAILSIFILGSFGLYVFTQGQGNSSVAFIAPDTTSSTKNTNQNNTKTETFTPPKPTGNTQKQNPAPAYTPPTPPKNTGMYKDGTYNGSVADAYYGNVQVQVIITNGKISDVLFLDYPHHAGTSRYINSQAMPYLTQEAIQAQSANVDGVSGASATSAAFVQSLSSALIKARA